jgi:DNA repair exonuclease SbcCD ATPase subunit
LAAQAARRQSLSRQVESGRVALAECDLNELEASAAAFSDEAEVAELLRKAEEMAKAAEVARNTASNALTLIQAQLEAARVELQAADAADHEAAQRVPGDFLGALAKSKERLVSLGAQLAELEAELARLTHAKNEELELVKKKLQLAQTAERSAFDQLESNRSQLTAAKQRLDEHRGGLTLLEAAAASADIQGATKAVQIAKDELAAATAPGAGAPFPTDSDVATAREKLELAEVAFHAKRTEQAEARGSLLQVRGDVIVEEVTDATAALAQHKREREELEVEYGAWQLLEATLREAEKSEATNLGDRLAAPVQQRFSALTGGRYAKVEVGPDLRTAGFVAAGETRDVATLSAGTQEQLSTIFRLCLAEALQTAVILDDHLSQTDSQRMAWFRNALDEVAGKAQVIVISCWPEHYAQAAAAIDSGAGIDASAVIERY